MISLRTLTAERMNGPGASDDLATMPCSARDEVFFSGFNGNASVTKYQGITALNDHHVLVVVVHVRSGMRGLVASPECHLTHTRAVVDIALNTRRGLTAGRDPVCSRLHELWKVFHGLYP